MSDFGPASPTPGFASAAQALSVSGSGDFILQVNLGLVPGVSVVHKYGRDSAMTNTIGMVRPGGGILNWVTSSSTLLVASSSSLDGPGQDGARTVEIQGLDANFDELVETVTLNGTNFVETSGSFIRTNRAFVTSVGAYGQDLSGSNVGEIVIRHSASFEEMSRINVENGIGSGQTEQANYTVPAGKTAFMTEIHLSNDKETGTPVEYRLWSREAADVVTPPGVQSQRIVSNYNHSGRSEWSFGVYRRFPEKTDIWVTAQDSNGTKTNVEYTLILVDD